MGTASRLQDGSKIPDRDTWSRYLGSKPCYRSDPASQDHGCPQIKPVSPLKEALFTAPFVMQVEAMMGCRGLGTSHGEQGPLHPCRVLPVCRGIKRGSQG